mgnify:CR=1 FL=1
MNNNRRKEIKKIITELQLLQIQIEQIRNTEQDYYDNIPENLQTRFRVEIAETL